MSERGLTDVERAALALRVRQKGPGPLLDWRLYGATTALVAVIGLILAAVLFYRDSVGKDHAAECRASAAATLRDADSEVIRQSAILKEREAQITGGWSGIVVKLTQPTTDPGARDFTVEIAEIARGQAALGVVTVTLDTAIEAQRLARIASLASIERCGR